MSKKLHFHYVEFPTSLIRLKTYIIRLIKQLKTKDINFITITIQLKLNNSLYLTIGPRTPLNITSIVEINNYVEYSIKRYSVINDYCSLPPVEAVIYSYAVIDEKDYIFAVNAIKYIKESADFKYINLSSPRNLPLNTNYETWGKSYRLFDDSLNINSIKGYHNSDTSIRVKKFETAKGGKQYNINLYNKFFPENFTDIILSNSTGRFKRISKDKTAYILNEKIYFIENRDVSKSSYLLSLKRSSNLTLLSSIIDIESIFNQIDDVDGKILFLFNYPGVDSSQIVKYPAKLLFSFKGTTDIRSLKEYKNLFEEGVGYYKVLAKAPLQHPLIPVKPSKTKWQAWYNSEELKKALELGYKFKILEGYIYSNETL